jgi:predicted phage tail protein
MAIEHRVREAVDAYVARVRHDLDAHVRGLTSDLARLITEQQDQWHREIDRSVSEARAESERVFRARIEGIRDELTREMETRLSRERAEMREAMAATANKQGVRDSRVDTVERLLGSVRRIDEAGTLSGILEALARGAAAETSRVAVLLVDGDMFRTWGHFGFAAGVGPTEMLIGVSGTLAAAVALHQTSFVPPLIEGRESTVPAFMRVPVGHTGLVVPLTVGGEVVAVLYADDVDRTAEQEDAPVWTEEVELLARHAALRLENVTSVRTVEVLARTD